MLKNKLNGLAVGLMLIAGMIAQPIHAVSLDVLIANNGTPAGSITQGNLVFSNFTPNPLNVAGTVEVTGFTTAAGVNGIRFTRTPVGNQFALATTGAARELVVDATFTVTVTDPSFLIHSLVQGLDPASIAVGNAVLRNLTGIPSGAPTTTLFSCVQGADLPAGNACPSPIDSLVLPANASTLDVDRQIQILVGQKGAQILTGNAAAGFFDVAFPEISCPVLTSVSIAATGSTAVCAGATGGTATVTDIGGGPTKQHSWGYRTVTGGFIIPLPETLPTYLINGPDFPAAGSYLLVCTTTPTCGGPSKNSNEIPVTINPAPPLPVITGPSGFCPGASITLSSSSATGNLWSNGATTQSITVSTAGSYTVTVSGVGACSTASAPFVVTAFPAPPTPTISGPTSFCAGGTITLTSSTAMANLWSTGATTPSIIVSTAGSYTVKVTNASGCSATSAPFAVTANALPPTPTISGPSALCPGSTITVTSSSATGNLWSTGAVTQSITVSAAGSYSVTVTDVTGCAATSVPFAVTTSPVPATPIISGPTSFCPGTTITLTSSTATGNLWSTGATTPSIIVSTAGSYTVKVTNASGCSATSAAVATTLSSFCGPGPVVDAHAISSVQVSVTWSPVTGATSYQLFRRAVGGAFILIAAVTTNGFSDTVVANSAYLYRVRAVSAAGSFIDSVADLATTVIFTDDPLIAGTTPINAIHLAELPTAVNAVRALAGLPAATFTEAAAPGVVVKAIHINELRTALDAALSALGLPAGGYTDVVASGLPIKAIHFQELRNRVK